MKRFSTKSYSGQDGYGYGSIYDPEEYLEDRYKKEYVKVEEKIIPMDEFVCGDFSDNGICSIVAITRVATFYAKNGYDNIPKDYKKNFEKIISIAEQNGYTEKKGTPFYKIRKILKCVFEEFGYRNTVLKTSYIWSFDTEVKREIDAGRPVIMNIARGHYVDHSITVCGYAIFREKDNERTVHRMICVHDGWREKIRFIDYEDFAYDYLRAGIGSFNLIKRIQK
ncbi:MAG: hypothetical protein K6G88_07075 [Lachnospiraceae bacterium]|nr:hypothetical protein [Lachnospiraceae bacterium]